MFITKQARETQTPSVTERRKKPCEKPGSVGGPVPLRPDEPVVCSNCSKVSVTLLELNQRLRSFFVLTDIYLDTSL